MNQLRPMVDPHPDRHVTTAVFEVAGPAPRDEGGAAEYLRIARRHMGTLMATALIGGAIAAVLTLTASRVYQATTSIEVQGLNQEFLNMGSVNPTVSDSGYDVYSDIQTHVRVMQSRRTIERTSKRLEAQPRPADLQPADRLGMWRQALNVNPASQGDLWNQALGMAAGSVRVRASGTNRVVEVTCDSTHPQVAADFCNTLAQEYIDLNLESRWQTTEYTGQWLTKQLQELKIKLGRSEEELQAFVRQAGLVMATETTGAEEGQLANLQKELSVAQADRITKQSKYEMAVASPSTALPEILDDPTLKETEAALAELHGKAAQLEVTYTPQHAEVRKARAQAAALEASLALTRGNMLQRIRNDFEGARRREALLLTAYAEQVKLRSGQAEERAHYDLLKREVDASRLLYDNILQKLKEASIASALRATNIRIIDEAERPGGPYKPNLTRQGIVGLLLGLVAGLGLVVVRERMDRTLQDPGDSVQYLRVPELGVVPAGKLVDSGKAGKGTGLLQPVARTQEDSAELVVWREKSSLLADSYRTTLTSILFTKNGDARPRVMVFTSAHPKDGKTTTVCNLAMALAEINRSVLLIDGDMRRPRLHSIFNVANDRGLSDLLLDQTPLTAAALTEASTLTSVPGVRLLTSGSVRRNAPNLLHSARLAELLKEARGMFDTVLIDAPPLVNIADARVLGRLADGVIIVVRSGVTTRDAALSVKQRITEDGIPVLGTILNFWNPKARGHEYYGYYSGYYSYHGDDAGSDDQDGGSDETTERQAGRPGGVAPGVKLGPQFNRANPVTESDN